MKVRATRMGYYGVARIREGEVFEIKDEKDFSLKWMAKVNGEHGDEREVGDGEMKEGESVEADIDPETGLLRKPRRGKRF